MSKIKLKNKQKNLEFQEIYGLHSVLAALQNTNRKHSGLFIIESTFVGMMYCYDARVFFTS